MGTVITNLKAIFGVDAKGADKGLKQGKDALVDFDKKVEKSILGLKDMLTPLALLGAAGGGFAILKESIESIEGPGDRFEAMMGGVKEACFEAGRALATMDFSGFFSNMEDGYARGKQFAEVLDELKDKASYNDYRIAQLKHESAALQEIVKDKTKELSVRADAAEQVKTIEEKIMRRRTQLAKEEFEVQKSMWKGRNKMEAEEAVKMYETIDALSEDTKTRLRKAFDTSLSYSLGNMKQALESVKYNTGNFYGIADIDPSVIESYSKFFVLLQKGERDVLVKLFNTFKDIDTVGYQAQEDYNSTIRMTSSLLDKENKSLQAVVKTKKDENAEDQKAIDLRILKGYNMDNSPGRADISNLAIPDLAPNINALAPHLEKIKTISVDIAASVNEAFTSMAEGLSMFIGALASGEVSGGDFGKVIGGIFGELAITVGRICIAAGFAKMALEKALISFGGAGLAIGAGVALMAIGSAVKGSMSKAIGAPGGGGGYGSNNFTYDARPKTEPVKIQIYGKLTAEGSDLVYVINNENNKQAMISGRKRG
jgi:hypothetical protein